MNRTKTEKSSVKWATRFAHAAGTTGVFANPFFAPFDPPRTDKPRTESSPAQRSNL